MTQNTDRDSLAFARRTWRTLEPYHGAVYFSPEAAGQYAELGVDARTGYFASRSAALGAAPAEVVIAAFYNFNPQLVRRAIPAAWEAATPQRFAAARLMRHRFHAPPHPRHGRLLTGNGPRGGTGPYRG